MIYKRYVFDRRKYKKRFRKSYEDIITLHGHEYITIKAKLWLKSEKLFNIPSNNIRWHLKCTPRYGCRVRGYE